MQHLNRTDPTHEAHATVDHGDPRHGLHTVRTSCISCTYTTINNSLWYLAHRVYSSSHNVYQKSAAYYFFFFHPPADWKKIKLKFTLFPRSNFVSCVNSSHFLGFDEFSFSSKGFSGHFSQEEPPYTLTALTRYPRWLVLVGMTVAQCRAPGYTFCCSGEVHALEHIIDSHFIIYIF